MAASARNTSLGKDLQNYAEAVKNADFPEAFALSLSPQLRLILSFKLSFALTLSVAPEGHRRRDVVDSGLYEFFEVFDLSGFELCVDVEAVNIIFGDVVSHKVELAFGEKCLFGDSARSYKGGVGEGLSQKFVSPLLV